MCGTGELGGGWGEDGCFLTLPVFVAVFVFVVGGREVVAVVLFVIESVVAHLVVEAVYEVVVFWIVGREGRTGLEETADLFFCCVCVWGAHDGVLGGSDAEEGTEGVGTGFTSFVWVGFAHE